MSSIQTVHLRCVDSARNKRRFYVISVEPTLFGGMSLVRHWGRIGTIGRLRVDMFETMPDALMALTRLEQSKRRRGYVGAAKSSSAVTEPS